MRTKRLLIASAAAIAIALPALAQQVAQTQPAPATPLPAATTAQPQPQHVTTATPDDLSSGGADETAVEEVTRPTTLVSVKPPVEYPGWARRDPWAVGKLDPAALGLGENP